MVVVAYCGWPLDNLFFSYLSSKLFMLFSGGCIGLHVHFVSGVCLGGVVYRQYVAVVLLALLVLLCVHCVSAVPSVCSSAVEPIAHVSCHAVQHALPIWLPSECWQSTAVTMAALVSSYAAWQCSLL
jgi:hypothetical protein